MKKSSVNSAKAPRATGPFSQAILDSSRYRLELSGQVGIDPTQGKLVDGGIIPQTKQTIANIEAVLSEIGWNFENLIKVRIFLTDMNDYQQVNELYAKQFSNQFPARVALAVKALPLGALVEIDCTAAGNEISKEAQEKYGIQ